MYIPWMKENIHKLLLTFVVTLFAISAAVSVLHIKRIIEMLEAPRTPTTWGVVQLQREHDRFINSIRLFQLQDIDKDELMLRYDILWSRFPVLLEAKEMADLLEIKGAQQLIKAYFAEVQGIESFLEGLSSPVVPDSLDSQGLSEAIGKLKTFGPQVNALVNNEFHRFGHSNEGADQDILKLITFLSLCIGGLLMSGGMLVVMIIRENRQNEFLARHDVLTLLPNRAALARYATGILHSQGDFACMILDLNGFKAVNDTYGHEFGDRLLQAVAKRLKRLMRNKDLLARIGGDEFALIQTDVINEQSCICLAQRIVDAVTEPIHIDGIESVVGLSIGISISTEKNRDWQELMCQADTAMYVAKRQFKSSHWIFYKEPMAAERHRQQRGSNSCHDGKSESKTAG